MTIISAINTGIGEMTITEIADFSGKCHECHSPLAEGNTTGECEMECSYGNWEG